MKKLVPILLCLFLSVLLLVSCSDSSGSKEPASVQAYFKGYTVTASKDLSSQVDVEVKDDSELYWTYTVREEDGEAGEETAMNGDDTGFPDGSFGQFTSGTYYFTFNAYETYSDGEYDDIYYSGVERENTLSESNSSVYGSVVRCYTDTTGTLAIKDITTYQADETEADASGYDITVTLQSLTTGTTYSYEDTDKLMLAVTNSESGFTNSLDPDYYSITITLSATIDGEDYEIASGTVDKIYILKGGTTTVTGNITEGTTTSITLVVTVSYTDADGTVVEETIYGGDES